MILLHISIQLPTNPTTPIPIQPTSSSYSHSSNGWGSNIYQLGVYGTAAIAIADECSRCWCDDDARKRFHLMFFYVAFSRFYLATTNSP